jgi:hypothetical protein
MEGRYFVTDLTGHMKMPGPDGKPKDVTVSAVGLLFNNWRRSGECWEGASGAYR